MKMIAVRAAWHRDQPYIYTYCIYIYMRYIFYLFIYSFRPFSGSSGP